MPQRLAQHKAIQKIGLRRGRRENAATFRHRRPAEAIANRRRNATKPVTHRRHGRHGPAPCLRPATLRLRWSTLPKGMSRAGNSPMSDYIYDENGKQLAWIENGD